MAKQFNVRPDRPATITVHPTPGIGDATTIADGLAMLPAAGGSLLLREGTYSISATLTLPDKAVTIRGSGESTVVSLGANAIPAFTIPVISALHNYVFEDFNVTGTSVANQKIWSIGDTNSRGVVYAKRIHSTGVQFPIHITADGGEPVTVNLEDCHFVPLTDGSGILINTPDSAGVSVNAYMQRVRFYDAFEDAITGALTAGGFYDDFTGVNIIGEDCTFAIGTGSTMGSIALHNCHIMNFGPNANPIIAVADDNFGITPSSLVGCGGAFVNFDFAGNGTHVYGGFYDSCSFTDGAISFFTDVYFFDDLAADEAVIIGSSDTFVKGCFFDNAGTDYVLDGKFNTIAGNRFGSAPTAVIRLTNSSAAVTDNNFLNLTPAVLEAGAAASCHNRLDNNEWTTPPTLLASTRSTVDDQNVRTVSSFIDGGVVLDRSYRTVLINNGTGDTVTVQLPAAADVPFHIYNIKKIDANPDNVVIDADASTIDGAASITFNTQYVGYTIQSDGTEWWIL